MKEKSSRRGGAISRHQPQRTPAAADPHRMPRLSGNEQREAPEALTPDNWVWLNPDDRVKVQREREAMATGVIDVVAPDASIFWIWLDGGRGRVALHMDDNVSVWLEEKQD